ncbi:hypothetical protein NKH17_23095 [Mesorhizobium sp. M1334]
MTTKSPYKVSTKIGGHLVMEEDEQKLRVRLVGPDGRRQSAVRPRTAGASGIEAHFAAVITFQAGFQRGKATLIIAGIYIFIVLGHKFSESVFVVNCLRTIQIRGFLIPSFVSDRTGVDGG